MQVTNISQYPDHVIKLLVRFVANELEIADYVHTVNVTSYRGTYRGRCSGRRVLIRIGAPSAFPYNERKYRKHAPEYSMGDWMEGFVAIAGHELQHSRQFRAFGALGAGVKRVKRTHFSEVDAERGAMAVLTAFRAKRPELEAEIARADAGLKATMARWVEAAARRKAAKLEANAPDAKRARKLEAARRALKAWNTKAKRAATAIQKYERTIRRLEREQAKAVGIAAFAEPSESINHG